MQASTRPGSGTRQSEDRAGKGEMQAGASCCSRHEGNLVPGVRAGRTFLWSKPLHSGQEEGSRD